MKKPIRQKTVLVVSSTFPRWKGDSRPSFVYDLCNNIRGYRIIVLAPHHEGAKKKERMGNLTVYRFKYFFERHQTLCSGAGILQNSKTISGKTQLVGLLFAEFIAIRKIIKREKIDIIHPFWIFPQGIICRLAKGTIPMITSGMGTDIFVGLNNTITRRAEEGVLKSSRKIAVTSIALKNEITKYYPDMMDKIRIVPMGVDVEHFRAKSVKKGDGANILCIGRLTEQKGIQYALEAMPKIVQKHGNAKLVVVGDGAYSEELRRISQTIGMDDHVEFAGAIAHEQIADFLNKADIFVFPSLSDPKLGTEAFGVVLLEALASKVPVVATNVGGIPDIIHDKKSGILIEQRNAVEIAEAVLFLLDNADAREAIVKLGYSFVKENFNWKTVAARMEQVYDSIK